MRLRAFKFPVPVYIGSFKTRNHVGGQRRHGHPQRVTPAEENLPPIVIPSAGEAIAAKRKNKWLRQQIIKIRNMFLGEA